MPKVAPTSKFFAELRASLRNAQDVTADLSAVVGRLRLENERMAADAERYREALAAYRSALRSGEPETEQLRRLSDAAFKASE